MKARLKADYIFHIKPRIEGLLQIGYPCVALSALFRNWWWKLLICKELDIQLGWIGRAGSPSRPVLR